MPYIPFYTFMQWRTQQVVQVGLGLPDVLAQTNFNGSFYPIGGPVQSAHSQPRALVSRLRSPHSASLRRHRPHRISSRESQPAVSVSPLPHLPARRRGSSGHRRLATLQQRGPRGLTGAPPPIQPHALVPRPRP